MRILRIVLLVTGIPAIGMAAAQPPEPASEPCTLSGSLGIASVEARCGWLERPENPDDPHSATVRLRFAVVAALSPNPKADAFTVINGGPGASSLHLFADMAAAFTRIRRERDILLLDQRGTGRSNPLDCPGLDDMALDEAAAHVRAGAAACLAALPGDPRFYTTSVAVRDLEALRVALGYESLNVYGVSYGSRVAQHYARRYPGAVRTLVIDGIVPPDVPLGPNAALNAQRALDRLFSRCAGNDACAARFPALPRQLAGLKDRLGAGALPLRIAHPVSGHTVTVQLTRTHLVVTLRMLSYAPETAALLPLIIDEAYAHRNYVPLAANAMQIEQNLAGALSFGMHNSVVCTEDIPFLNDPGFPALEATYIGAGQTRSLQAICQVWPAGFMDDDLRLPLTAEVPTLILSGEEDPITPPGYGERVRAHLPRSLHLVGRGQGHGLVNRGCLPRLVSEFVETAELDDLDTSCVERLAPEPFFLNFMGPVAAPETGGGAP